MSTLRKMEPSFTFMVPVIVISVVFFGTLGDEEITFSGFFSVKIGFGADIVFVEMVVS